MLKNLLEKWPLYLQLRDGLDGNGAEVAPRRRLRAVD